LAGLESGDTAWPLSPQSKEELLNNQLIRITISIGGEEAFGHPDAAEGADFYALFALNALVGVDGDAFFLFADFNGVSGADFGAHGASGALFFVVADEAFVAFADRNGRRNRGFAFRDFGQKFGDRWRQVLGDEWVRRRFAEELLK